MVRAYCGHERICGDIKGSFYGTSRGLRRRIENIRTPLIATRNLSHLPQGRHKLGRTFSSGNDEGGKQVGRYPAPMSLFTI